MILNIIKNSFTWEWHEIILVTQETLKFFKLQFNSFTRKAITFCYKFVWIKPIGSYKSLICKLQLNGATTPNIYQHLLEGATTPKIYQHLQEKATTTDLQATTFLTLMIHLLSIFKLEPWMLPLLTICPTPPSKICDYKEIHHHTNNL